MIKQLEKEQEEDEEIYEKMACWCGTNDKEKTKSIADGEAHIDNLETEIEELTAASARLNQEIANLEAEIAKNQEALEKATAMRQKQLAEFNSEEKDMIEALGAMKQAIEVLQKHHPNLIQSDDALVQIGTMMRKQMKNHADILGEVITPAQKRQLASFAQAPKSLIQVNAEPYAPQSGQILGILKQMKETFEANLSQSQKEEQENQTAYEDLKAAKEAEIAAAKEQVNTKTQELAATDEKNANAKEDLEDTKNTMGADMEFLANLKEHCANVDQEWEARQNERQEEMAACSKALQILTSDDARDLFSKTLGFTQMASSTKRASTRRDYAAKVLSVAAKKFQNPKLAQLATQVRLDAFTKVKKAIDDMVAELMKQKDWCVDEMQANEKTTELKTRDRDDLTAHI